MIKLFPGLLAGLFLVLIALPLLILAQSPPGCSPVNAATYSPQAKTITLNNQTSTPCTIYQDINNESVFSYDPTTGVYTSYAHIKVLDTGGILLNNVTLHLVSNNKSDEVYNLIVNGKLNASASEISAWNTINQSYALLTDVKRSIIYINGINSSATIMNSQIIHLGRADPAEDGLNIDAGVGYNSIYIDRTDFLDTIAGFEGFSSYAGSFTLKNSWNLDYIRNHANNSVFHNNTVNGGTRFTLGRNITLSNSTGTRSTWNSVELDSSQNVTVYGMNIYNSSHNGIQMGGGGAYPPPGKYILFKSNEVHHLLGGTGGSNAYMISGQDAPYQWQTDSVIEDSIAHDLRHAQNGILASDARDITIRRYRSWNLTDDTPDIAIQTTDNFVVVDSTLSGSGFDILASNNTKIINSVYALSDLQTSDLTSYYYFDANVMDANNLPVQDITILIPEKTYSTYWHSQRLINITNSPVNLHGEVIQVPLFRPKVLKPMPITSALTGADGHTPLPSDEENTLVLADKRLERYSSASPWNITNFLYDIYAYDIGNIWTNITHTIYPNGTIIQQQPLAQATNIRPNASWYRLDPNMPANTITVQINHTRTGLSAAPSVNPVNMTVNYWNASAVIVANFTADTTDGNGVVFTANLKPYTNYLIKKDGANYTIVRSDSTGKITFNNSAW